jgi:hypothetical protein
MWEPQRLTTVWAFTVCYRHITLSSIVQQHSLFQSISHMWHFEISNNTTNWILNIVVAAAQGSRSTCTDVQAHFVVAAGAVLKKKCKVYMLSRLPGPNWWQEPEPLRRVNHLLPALRWSYCTFTLQTRHTNFKFKMRIVNMYTITPTVTLCFCSTFTEEKCLWITKQWTGAPWFHVSDLCWWECNSWSWKLKVLLYQWKSN